MPVVHQDAKKRARQSIRRAERNHAVKGSLKTAAKRFVAAVDEKDKDQSLTLYKKASGLYDQAAAKGIIHKNAAARKKSRLRLKLNALNAAAAPTKKAATKKPAKAKAS